MTTDPGRRRALEGVRVLEVGTAIAGQLAAMLLADFGADVVKVEQAGGDPMRARPGFAMWNRGKRSVVNSDVDLVALVGGADLVITGGGPPDQRLDPDEISAAHPALVVLDLPPFLGETPWAGGEESAALLWAASGMALRQSSYEGGPVDPVAPYVLYLQGIWAAAAAVSALFERAQSGFGQVVTVGGVHATMVAASATLAIDPAVPEVLANYGPGGPHPMYTRYQCADGVWLFLATLTTKFQAQALDAMGLSDILEDERIQGRLDAVLLPANRNWVRERLQSTFAARTSEEWIEILKGADVPVGPLLRRGDWLDSPAIEAVGMRVEVEDPSMGPVAMAGNPINLVRTPARVGTPAPSLDSVRSDIEWAPRSAPAGTAAQQDGPLSGTRVLDLGTILAGPYAGTLLAELGADVIKVEIPAGDSWRERGMPYIRGQRGVAIDLRNPRGLEVFHRLVKSADVVVDNYRAGVLKRLRIDYEHLRAVNPDIVCVSITGFGEGGPFSSEPAFDPLLQARSGMMIAQGGDSEPVLSTVAINDVTTAALAVLGTVLALFSRRVTGDGQAVWLSLAGTSAFAQNEELLQAVGRQPAAEGGRDYRGPGPLDRSYPVSDGWIRLQIPADRLDDLGVAEPDGSGSEGPEHLEAALGQWLSGLTREDAVARVNAAGGSAAPHRRLSEILADGTYAEWHITQEMVRPGSGPVRAPGRYARFSRTQRRDVMTPPGVGEHTREVLNSLGYADPDIEVLATEGAIKLGEPMVFRTLAAYR